MPNNTAVLQAISAPIVPAGRTFIALRWESVNDTAGYRLYRSTVDAATPPAGPLGGATPIRIPTSAAELRTVIAAGSPEWDSLANVLTAAQPGTPAGGTATPVDPAAAFDRGLTDTETQLIKAAAQTSLALGRVAGLAYRDSEVTAGESYIYELRGVRRNGTEHVLASGIAVTAGTFTLPDPPSGVRTQPGDRRVLVMWNRNPYAANFTVQRATAPGGPYAQINPLPVVFDLTADIDGQALPNPQPGFLDAGGWGPDGMPTSRNINAAVIDGPDTGLTYYYRVASRDILGRAGGWSAPVAATPVRLLAPMAPDEVQVTPTTTADGIVVRWRTVTRNVENHCFVHQGVPDTTQTNHIYRADSREALDDPQTLAAYLVATITSDPYDLTAPVQSWTDTDPILVPPYGTKPYFYRIQVTDPFGNLSAPSAVISAAVPDTTPPGPTTITTATGAVDHIHLEWTPNTEPDVGGYQVYRGVCDHGAVFIPGYTSAPQRRELSIRLPHCDMTLVGDVAVSDAQTMFRLTGVVSFDDYTVPAGSPICYAYWVRAYDHAGNLYPGNRNGCPKQGEYSCAALREDTPPHLPVLSALRARNNGVLLEWVGAPDQDLHAFHVYRSETPDAPPQFLACVYTDGTVSTTRWEGMVPSCSAVPAVTDPQTTRATYLDGTAEPHRVYWYRISALDWLGNESSGADISDIPASSTFTFTSDLPGAPTVLPPPAPEPDQCGLNVAWDPPFDADRLDGFIVFRRVIGQPYRQVSNILTANSFSDMTARRGVDYLYRVQAIDHTGTLSEPSAPVAHHY
jgi:hypothetical protein